LGGEADVCEGLLVTPIYKFYLLTNTKSSPNKTNHIVEMYGLQVNGHTPPSFLNILPIINPINAPIIGPKISFNTIVKNYPSLFPK
jgi:hypothetical protein